MHQSENYQEHDMPNGVYIIEKRMGHWMLWAPDDGQTLYVDYSYDLVKLMMETHSKEAMK